MKYKMHNSNIHLLPDTFSWVVINRDTVQNIKIHNYSITVYGTMSPDCGTEVAVKTYCLHLQMACVGNQQAPPNHS